MGGLIHDRYTPYFLFDYGTPPLIGGVDSVI